MPPRCPKGTRRNKISEKCESSGAAKPTVRCPKGTRRNKQGHCDSVTTLDKKETKDLYLKKCLVSVEKNGLALKKVDTSKFVKYWKKDMSESDMDLDMDVFRLITKTAIEQNPKAIKYLDFECKILDKYDIQYFCLLAVEKDGMLLKDIPEGWRWDDIIEAAVKQNGMALQYNPNDYSFEDWNNNAVKQNGMALQFIHVPDKETCIFAVKQNGLAFQFVKRDMMNLKKDEADEEYERIFKVAVKQNPRAKKFYKKP